MVLGVLGATALLVALTLFFVYRIKGGVAELSGGPDTQLSEPEIKVTELITGLDHPWDIVFPTREVMFYSLRAGEIRGRMLSTAEEWTVAKPDNLVASGEGGMLGIALDTAFADTHYLFACYNARADKGPDVRVVRYEVSNDLKSVANPVPIVAGIQSQGGRHSGCRLTVDRLGNVWIGTGDSALAAAPQDPKSLAGKVLRVTKEGDPVAGNLKDPYDPRIFSYGHRNIQGIVLTDKPLSNGAYGFTVEQGTSKDDELNYLLPGNFGWDPNKKGVYDEEAPMTDLTKFPDAIRSTWSTGSPTLALSGIEQFTMKRWQAWRGRLIIGGLKAQELRLIELNERGEYLSDKSVLSGKYGRLRTAVEGPDGNLYVPTDNGSGQDKILKVQVICTVCD